MKNKIGYKDSAIIYSLDDEQLQVIRCKRNSKLIISSSFIGSGKLSAAQTLEIATKDKLKPNIRASQCRCLYDGSYYLITAIFTQDSAPIKNKNRSIKDTILALQ